MVFDTTCMSTRTSSMEEQVDAIVEQVLLLLPPSHRQANSLVESMPGDTTLPRHRMIQQFLRPLPLDLLAAIFARIYELPVPDSQWAVDFNQACERDRDQVTRNELKGLLVRVRDGRPNVIVQPHGSLISTTLAERINHDLNQIRADMDITDTQPTKETQLQPMAHSTAPTQLTLASNRTIPSADTIKVVTSTDTPTTSSRTSTSISSSATTSPPSLASSHPHPGASSVAPSVPGTANSVVPPVTHPTTNRPPRRTAVHTNPAAAIIKAQNAHLATPTSTAAPNTMPPTAATVQNQVTSPPSVNHTNPTTPTPAIGRNQQQNNTAAHSRQRQVSELANNTVPTIF